MDIIEQIKMLNKRHVSLFKASLIDESIDITIDNLKELRKDLRRILEYIDIWIDNLYKDETEIKKYYINLKEQIISILNK